jgi:hypothetical protein
MVKQVPPMHTHILYWLGGSYLEKPCKEPIYFFCFEPRRASPNEPPVLRKNLTGYQPVTTACDFKGFWIGKN